jgi:hypothetical protein
MAFRKSVLAVDRFPVEKRYEKIDIP